MNLDATPNDLPSAEKVIEGLQKAHHEAGLPLDSITTPTTLPAARGVVAYLRARLINFWNGLTNAKRISAWSNGPSGRPIGGRTAEILDQVRCGPKSDVVSWFHEVAKDVRGCNRDDTITVAREIELVLRKPWIVKAPVSLSSLNDCLRTLAEMWNMVEIENSSIGALYEHLSALRGVQLLQAYAMCKDPGSVKDGKIDAVANDRMRLGQVLTDLEKRSGVKGIDPKDVVKPILGGIIASTRDEQIAELEERLTKENNPKARYTIAEQLTALRNPYLKK